MLGMFLTLYRYHWWATVRMLAALNEFSATELHRDLGGSFPSIQVSLLHILWVELLFLKRWQGKSTKDLARPPQLETITAIKDAWQQLEDERRRYLAHLSETDLQGRLTYTDTRGRSITIFLWQGLYHCANHSTFHQGQIISKIRQLEKIPPATDFILFCREDSDKQT